MESPEKSDSISQTQIDQIEDISSEMTESVL
jgi:hypothetical protein